MAGKITALVVQKRNKERVNVHLDGEFAFGLAMSEAMKLKKGQLLSDEDIARLKALDEIEVARERALNFLSFRPRSIAEVRRNLKDKDHTETAIEAVIERLMRIGLLDDKAFARFWVENRDRFKPRSPRAIRYELRQKGVADDAIQLALEDLDVEDAAYRAAEKRVRRYQKEDFYTFRKKMSDYLARKGFNYDVIRDVLDRICEEYGIDNTESENDLY